MAQKLALGRYQPPKTRLNAYREAEKTAPATRTGSLKPPYLVPTAQAKRALKESEQACPRGAGSYGISHMLLTATPAGLPPAPRGCFTVPRRRAGGVPLRTRKDCDAAATVAGSRAKGEWAAQPRQRNEGTRPAATGQGDLVLDGSSTLTLLTPTLQHLTQVFEQHLGSRNQNRGFVALPSHPAETAAILQAQFLFDVLQKTHSLKLVHVPNCVLQSAVKIFPFKSLRHLELRSVPPHCLRGLRFVYSQLESLTCCKCISTLEEIISACGGDLSCALPWLELQTVNFSYNSITALDDSLQLLNALRVLDLSHNKIQDCEHYLTTLTELEYLNLAYNFLSKVPNLSIFSRSKLVTLILRNNELDSINGVEQLVNLQHLDVAYNLLLEHSQLAPLSTLHYVKKLHLEGNPLWFHQNHRSATLVHLSPRAASSNFLLDGEPLSSSDLMHLPRLVQSVSQSIHTSTSEKTALDRSALDSSCAADFSDSQSPAENVAVRLPRKKSKGKVKVRRASISEPSDTEHEAQALPLSADLVLQHQKEMKRLDSFRDRFGVDWLQYKRHLEQHDQVPVICRSRSADEIAGRPAAMDLQSESSDPEQGKLQVSQKDSSPPVDDTEKEEEPEVQLDEPVEGEQREEEADELMLGEEEEEKPEVDLCQPVLVSQIEGEGDPEPDWIFLRVTAKHVIEVELKAARVLHKLELKCLQKVETSEMNWRRMDLERVFPVLTLHFSYIRKDRQKRKYVVLDDSPEQCLQSVLEVLSPAVEENRRNQDQEKGSTKLQCLKCKQEFSQSLAHWHQGPYPSEVGDAKILESLVASVQGAAAASEPIACPSCSSDHVVILPSEVCPSTPLPPGPDSTSEDLSDSVLEGGSQQEGPEETPALASETGRFYIGGEDSLEMDTSNSTRTPELSGEHDGTLHSSSRSSDGGSVKKELGMKSQYLSLSHTDTNGGSLMGSYRYSMSRGPTPSQLSLNSESEDTWNLNPSVNGVLNTRDFRSVDHRLKLYLDMEVFEENAEEFQCFLKVVMVKFGRQGEFLSILVASDLKIYVLEVTGTVRGQPADWLKKNDSHYLSDISHLEVGLCHQSLRMEFDNPKASYNLLIRNQSCCDQFLQTLTYLMQELPAKHRSKVKEIPAVEMNPQHWLWPLLDSKTTDSAAADGTCFFYLLAYLIQEYGAQNWTPFQLRPHCQVDRNNETSHFRYSWASAFPVTLLSTRSMLFLLEENHQWQVQASLDEAHEAETPPRSNIQLKEKQSISSISNIITYRLCPCDIKLMLYDEVLKVESTWHIRTECPELLVELVEWIRKPWEEMFSIELRKAMYEGLE
nr:PREDICTED: serine/threonine-protein kinase 11-interacting protein [Opisthocomus hoazin]